MLKLIDAEKAKLFGLPANDISDESKYPLADIQNAIEAGAFKRIITTTKAQFVHNGLDNKEK